MSYDVSLTINTGIEQITVVDCGNYTSNVWEMYEHAIPPAKPGERGGLHRLHDMKAGDAIELLQKGILHMKDHKEFYMKFNPKNGWGNYEGAYNFLGNILSKCTIHPACTVELSS